MDRGGEPNPGLEVKAVRTDARQKVAPAMILPEVRDSRFVTIRRGGTLTDSIRLTTTWHVGRPCAQSTSLTCSSRLNPRTRGLVRRSRLPTAGRVARSR